MREPFVVGRGVPTSKVRNYEDFRHVRKDENGGADRTIPPLTDLDREAKISQPLLQVVILRRGAHRRCPVRKSRPCSPPPWPPPASAVPPRPPRRARSRSTSAPSRAPPATS